MTPRTPVPDERQRESEEARARVTYAKDKAAGAAHRRKIKKGTTTETFTLLAPETVAITTPKPVKRYPQDR